MLSGFFSGEPAYDAPSFRSTGHHSMPRWSDTPPRGSSPSLGDPEYYADNWLWRDPMPPLPQHGPLAYQLDRRVFRPAHAAFPPEVVASYQRTSSIDVFTWGRSGHFVEPARDIAYQSYKMLWRARTLDTRRYDQLPQNAERYQIFPDIFWALGNPPLVDQATSREVVRRLHESNLLDAFGQPVCALGQASVAAALRHAPALEGVLREDFYRYATVTLNVAYDLLHAGDKEVREQAYAFSPPLGDHVLPPLDESHDFDEFWDPRRRNEVHAMLADMEGDYRRELLHEAVQAARGDDARPAAPCPAERARAARIARLLSPRPGPQAHGGATEGEPNDDARDVYDRVERYRVYHDGELTAEQARAVEALAERMADGALAL